jgi:hypothetical protein
VGEGVRLQDLESFASAGEDHDNGFMARSLSHERKLSNEDVLDGLSPSCSELRGKHNLYS